MKHEMKTAFTGGVIYLLFGSFLELAGLLDGGDGMGWGWGTGYVWAGDAAYEYKVNISHHIKKTTIELHIF